jgi:hypothetical protein
MAYIPLFKNRLTVSAINCNSLNSSVASKSNRNLKIHGVTKLGTDLILISDLRLSNKQLVSCAEDVKRLFQLNMYAGYDCFFNSTMNKRGVGILFNKKISYIVQEQRADREENYLLLKLTIKGEDVVIGSIYGPNDHNEGFFTNLKANLKTLSNDLATPIILGGDWNCTYCADPVDSNIDVFNMVNLPNKRHSDLLKLLCNEIKLCDPYRVLHFNKTDFTFIPKCEVKKK